MDWVRLRPELVCEVTFDYLQGNRFRHAATFKRWRYDKPPQDCGFEQIECPDTGSGIEALGCRRVGELRRPCAAEPVVHEIRYQEQRLRGIERRIAFGSHRTQLEHRVDRHELYPRALVELARGHLCEHAVHRLSPSRVAVVDGIPQKPPVTGKHSKIHGP